MRARRAVSSSIDMGGDPAIGAKRAMTIATAPAVTRLPRSLQSSPLARLRWSTYSKPMTYFQHLTHRTPRNQRFGCGDVRVADDVSRQTTTAITTDRAPPLCISAGCRQAVREYLAGYAVFRQRIHADDGKTRSFVEGVGQFETCVNSFEARTGK
jgi:hypothetical protein